MSNTHRQWQEIKANYLKAIEKNLAEIDHPQRDEILANVSDHLDNKYAELPSAQQTWEGYQQIITEMGPPREYADLLTEEKSTAAKNFSGLNTLLAVVFVLVLIGTAGYLVYAARNVRPAAPPSNVFEFEPDERVLGKWAAIDFVRHIDDFSPAKKNWPGKLFLLSLEFQHNGDVRWQAEHQEPMTLKWTKGKVEPLESRPSFYYLRNIDGHMYMFYEWVSGDVTDRGKAPAYYVLKQAGDDETVIPEWFENDPQAIGYWVAMDFVKTIEAFDPAHRQTADLFVKTLEFKDNGQLRWTIGDSQPIWLDWTKGKIRPFGYSPAAYCIKQFDQGRCLFYEYKTSQASDAGYYVFQPTDKPAIVSNQPDIAFVNDPAVLGEWVTVDFVSTPETFRPNQQSWQGTLYLKSLDFKEDGIRVSGFGEDNLQMGGRWTKGKLLEDELCANYRLETYDGVDYLFVEWISGDVTMRGQKPCYYVLKKAE